ncbi:MAG: calcium-binding protein [Hyphomicrobiaceae bacterium]
MTVESISHDPSGLAFSGGVQLDFGNSISYASDNILQSFRNLLVTSQPANSPVFGGIEDSALGNAAYFYNSGPFGNCGLLNGIGAAYLSFTFGAEFRYRYSTAGHVITEIDLGDGWHIVETYGRRGANNLIDSTRPEGEHPFYTLVELQEALRNGDPTQIWLDVAQPIRDYYGDRGAVVLAPAPTDPIYTNSHWSPTALTLAANERATLQRAESTLSDLYGIGALAPLDVSVPDGMTGVTVTRSLPPSGTGFEHIETSHLITDVKLQQKPGDIDVTTYYPAMAYDSVKLYPVAPTGTVALSSFTPGIAQDWTEQWTLVRGSLFEASRGAIIQDGTTGAARLTLNQTFTNAASTAVSLWLPLAFRTDTPIATGDAAAGPLAILHVGNQSIEITAADMALHYRDLVVTVPAGATVNLSLDLSPGRSLQLLALGTELDVAGILSAENPALAIDVDLSGIGVLREVMDLRFNLAGDANTVPTGLAGNDTVNASPLEFPPEINPFPLNELVVTRSQLPTSPDVETIETPYLVTSIDLTARTPGAFDFDAAREALRVYAAAPSWSVAMPGFERGAEQEWIGKWAVSRGATYDAGAGIVIHNPDGTYSELHSTERYTNTTDVQQFLWFPIAYRTDTPTRPADGSPVATLVIGQQWFNVYATDQDLHYKGVIVSIEPGVTVEPALYVYGGKTMEVYALGTSIELSDFISPENPIQVADVDFSGLVDIGLGDYRQHVDLTYAMMVNPYLSNEQLIGSSGNDTLTGSSADNHIDGGAGNDFLDGGAGRDRLLGGEGNDTVVWDAADDLDQLRGGDGHDVLLVADVAPVAFDLAAHGFEAARVVHGDVSATDAWTGIVDNYLPGWVMATQHGTYVSGASWLTRYEHDHAETWDYSVEYFDSDGQVTGNYVVADDATSYGIVLDADDIQSVAYYVNHLDAQNRHIAIQFVNDDGSSYGVSFDAALQHLWASSAVSYNEDSELVSAQTRYDDGSLISVSYDPNDQYSWATLTDFIDVLGRQTAQGAVYDDGQSIATYFDVDNVQPWNYETFEFDAAGQQIGHSFG